MDVLKSLYRSRCLLKTRQLCFQELARETERSDKNDPRAAITRHKAALLARVLGNYYRADKFSRQALQILIEHFKLFRKDGNPRYNFLGGVVFFRQPPGESSSFPKALLIRIPPIANPFHPAELILTEQSLRPDDDPQALLIWESRLHREVNDLFAVHLLSAPYQEQGLAKLCTFLDRQPGKLEGMVHPAELPELLQNWKKYARGSESAIRPAARESSGRPSGQAEQRLILQQKSRPAARETDEPEIVSPENCREAALAPTGQSTPDVSSPARNNQQEQYQAAQDSQDAAAQLAKLISRKLGTDKLKDLQSLIHDRDRKKIIRKLFDGDEQRYLRFAERLNRIHSWKAAARLVEDEFRERGINPYSKAALLFSDYVYKRFFPKEESSQQDRKF